MPLTITWDDGSTPPTQFVVPDDVLASLELFRQTFTSLQNGQFVETYATVKSLIIGEFTQSVIFPALNQFPTPAIQTAQANLASAQAAFLQSKAAALPGFGT